MSLSHQIFPVQYEGISNELIYLEAKVQHDLHKALVLEELF